MNENFEKTVLAATGARDLFRIETIQTLWSGYGEIVRYGLVDTPWKSVVVKHVKMPQGISHPRGWNTDLSHLRKVKSYEVETAWYTSWSSTCGSKCRVPHCLEVDSAEDEVLMVLEDLDAAGFDKRRTRTDWTAFESCLTWLAHFHCTFLGKTPDTLWETGTYWHLETRPDELERLDDSKLRQSAGKIDQLLKDSPFQTIVHGDAKLANFCFNSDNSAVAAIDFQYVGGGCGMKDLAYFAGSCFDEIQCERYEKKILDAYFKHFRQAADELNQSVDLVELEEDWRRLYPVAWTDFHRFLKGWSPGHWKINSYSERIEREVLSSL